MLLSLLCHTYFQAWGDINTVHDLCLLWRVWIILVLSVVSCFIFEQFANTYRYGKGVAMCLWKKPERDICLWVTHGCVMKMGLGQRSTLLFWKQASDILFGKWHSTPFIGGSVPFSGQWQVSDEMGPQAYANPCKLLWSDHLFPSPHHSCNSVQVAHPLLLISLFLLSGKPCWAEISRFLTLIWSLKSVCGLHHILLETVSEQSFPFIECKSPTCSHQSIS